MVEKGLERDVAKRIGEFVTRSGKADLVDELLVELAASPPAVEGLESLKLFFEYAELSDCAECIIFDLSLARGLDYYTGIIFEAVLTSNCI